MRYYNLVISDPVSGLVWKPTPSGNGFMKSAGGSTFTSYVNNQTNLGALNIEFDIPVSAQNNPQGNAHIKVWGVGLGMIGQASQLAGQNFTLSAGMKPGLPLATAAAPQAGILLQGRIFQGFGNWEGVNQTLDLICQAGALTTNQNIGFNWPANTPLAVSLAATLAQAFPGYKQNIAIGNLVLPNTEAGSYSTIWQFASYLGELTQRIGAVAFGPQYPGVQLCVVGSTINAFDYTIETTVTNLSFQDLIGQPTWIDPATVSFKTMLRSDIGIGTRVLFPPGIQAPYAQTSAAAAMGPNVPASWRSVFQGKFYVSDIHHFANFRQPDGASWSTAFQASPITLVNT